MLFLGSKDKFPSFSRQRDEDDFCLKGNPKDFNDFQSSFGLPIFWLSLSTTKLFFFSFYHSLDTVTSFFIVLLIAIFPRVFEFGQHLATQCYMLVNFFIKPFLRIGFNAHLPYSCDLINESGEFSNEIRM